jgi:hypothetical protein
LKKESCSALKKKLDSVFSLYIRFRDGGRCITCGTIRDPMEMQCGHYVSRKCTALRWDEMNCNCQDSACNVFKYGDLITYREKLVEKYGEEAVKRLEERRHETVKRTAAWYHAMIDHYKALLKEYQK